MKRLLLSLILILSISSLVGEGWTKESPEVTERKAINLQIMKINNFFSNMGAYNSSARIGEIYGLLKSIGSAVSYKMLQELCASGELPASYLKMA